MALHQLRELERVAQAPSTEAELAAPATATARARRRTLKRNRTPTVSIDSIVGGEIADELEMRREPSALEHVPSVAADREDLILPHFVVVVQRPLVRVLSDGSAVPHRLAVVLAVRLKHGELEEAVGRAIKADVPDFFFHFLVRDCDDRVLDQARVLEAALLRKANKVVPVESAAQALAPEHRVFAKRFGHPTVAVHVAEVKFAPRLEDAEHLAKNCLLVRTQIDHAVADNDVKAVVRDLQICEPLDEALSELNVALREAKLLAVPFLVPVRNLQLLVRHVNTHHKAIFTDKLRQNIYVPASTTAEIENPAAGQLIGQNEPASVVLG
mmetsp:Transcript_414/g.1027  ORF Transcript_414/g.1027 Transcript_414/m.1027 type:complete len:327 (+) Transcript_414:243-1223(+)